MCVGIICDWDVKWYVEKEYVEFLYEDLRICKFIVIKFVDAVVFIIEIECAVNCVNILIYIVKLGMVIGKGGFEVENLRKELNKLIGK